MIPFSLSNSLSKKIILTAVCFFVVPSFLHGSEQQATYSTQETDDCEWTLLDEDNSFVLIEVEKKHSSQQQSPNKTDEKSTREPHVISDPTNTGKTPQQQLMDAVLQNNCLKAKAAIENGAQVNHRGKNKETLLHHACYNGNIEVVELLLQAGAKKDKRDKSRENAFYKACYKGHEKIAALLSKHGAYLLSEEDFSSLPEKFHSFTYNLISKRRALQQDLVNAVRQNDVPKAKAALAEGARVNCRTTSNTTLLHLACHQGKTKVAKLLLQAGASVKALNNNNSTPLSLASYQGPKELISILLEAGSMINWENSKKFTPLYIACFQATPNLEIAKLLIELGASTEKSTKHTETLLYKACLMGGVYENVAYFLSNHGALPLREKKAPKNSFWAKKGLPSLPLSKKTLGKTCNKIVAKRTQLIKQSLSEQGCDDQVKLLIQSFAR